MTIDSTVRLTGGGRTVVLTDTPEQLHRRPGGSGWGMAPVVNSWFEGAGDGTRLRGTRRTARNLAIPLDVLGDSRADIETALRALIAIIRDPFLVHVDYDDGRSYSIPAVYDSGLEGVYSDAPETWNTATINLKCPDPYWTSDATQSFVIAPTPAASPFVLHLSALNVASSAAFGNVNITNTGDVDSRPTWTIKGPGVNPTIAINGVGFVLQKTLATADIIKVAYADGGWTIVDQNGVNQYPYLQTSPVPIFPSIPPGGSIATASMSGTSADSYIAAVYPERREVVY